MANAGSNYSSDALEHFLEVAISAAEKAGQVIAGAWNETKVVEHKGTLGANFSSCVLVCISSTMGAFSRPISPPPLEL